jgi:hypothetical protein
MRAGTKNYRGIILSISQKDKSAIAALSLIGQKRVIPGAVTLYKVEVEPAALERTIGRLQDNMAERWLHIRGFYVHFYRDKELIVAFKHRVFRAHAYDKTTWEEMIEYGKSVHTPERQLDFFPCTVEQETY